jgi:hypothetical protein
MIVSPSPTPTVSAPLTVSDRIERCAGQAIRCQVTPSAEATASPSPVARKLVPVQVTVSKLSSTPLSVACQVRPASVESSARSVGLHSANPQVRARLSTSSVGDGMSVPVTAQRAIASVLVPWGLTIPGGST